MKIGERYTAKNVLFLIMVYINFHWRKGNALVSVLIFRDDERKFAALDTPGGRSCHTFTAMILSGRGFTAHETLPWFHLVNMNGRLYDPLIARMLSPDNNVQMPDYTQNFNRYTYALNNPLVYTDPDGEFFWIFPSISWSKGGGLSFGMSVVVGIPGVWSVQFGAGYDFGTHDVYAYVGASAMFNTGYISYSSAGGLSVGYTAGLSPFSGFLISTNFGTVGVNYNISRNSWSGNISAWVVDQGGWDFNPSISAKLLTEQTTNFFRKGRFINNDKMLKRYTDAKDYDGALKYFGFKGSYDPNYVGGDPGHVNPSGDITYGSDAFSGGFDKLYFTYDHEMQHRLDILSGKYDGRNMNALTISEKGEEEFIAYSHNYKRVGLYPNHGFNLNDRLNNAITNWNCKNYIRLLDYYIYNRPKWHFIYKIKRLW